MSILDASVILKWFVDEESSDQALRLREEFYRGEK
jgi:predicted nucleic acid-binding protein